MSKKVIRLTESEMVNLVKRIISEESYWDRIFGKAGTKDAAHSSLRSKGYSHTGREEEGEYTMFDGQKFYEDDIEYADPYDTGDIPRVEDDKLIIANPAWSL